MQLYTGEWTSKGERFACGVAINDQKKVYKWMKEIHELLFSVTDTVNFAHHFLFVFFVFITICCSICCFFRGVSLHILWWDVSL